MSASVPGPFEQMNSLYLNRVVKTEALPSPLKNEIRSQPVHMNNICITVGESELVRSGSSVKALMREPVYPSICFQVR